MSSTCAHGAKQSVVMEENSTGQRSDLEFHWYRKQNNLEGPRVAFKTTNGPKDPGLQRAERYTLVHKDLSVALASYYFEVIHIQHNAAKMRRYAGYESGYK